MFKYCTFSEYSLTNLINYEVCLHHHESFNDPFECRCEILEGFPKKDPGSSRYQQVVKAWGFDDPNDEVALESYDDYVFSLEGTEPSIPLTIDRARIGCFSKSGDNLLMWSHYSNGLRGFCLEFDSQMFLSESTEEVMLFEVLYDSKPAVIDTAVIAVLNDQVEFHAGAIYESEIKEKYLGQDHRSEISAYQIAMDDALTNNREIYQKMLATKPLEWQYEEELRVIASLEKADETGCFIKYPPEALRSVIIGEKMPMRQRAALTKALENYPGSIIVKTALREKNGFKVLIT